MSIFDQLAAEFPRDAVHWRAQTLTKDGTKALALAYLDARDVMDRLDEVCTPAGWRNTVTETPKGRLIATIEIKIGDEWVGKTDGAGDTDVEGDKGGISDALKRAAVLWGIGRYLYRMKAVWAPCESRDTGKLDKWNNKVWQWTGWKGSPWDAVNPRSVSAATKPTSQPNETTRIMIEGLKKCPDVGRLYEWLALNRQAADDSPDRTQILAAFNAHKVQLEMKEAA